MALDGQESSVAELLVEHLGVEPERVVREADLEDDLGADSLDIVELVMALEDRFGIEIDDDSEAPGLKTVGDLLDIVDRKTRDL